MEEGTPASDSVTAATAKVTHAHLDHSGYLPILARHGYAGPIVCTETTARLIAIVLRDAAHLQEEDAKHAQTFGYSRHEPPLPLFDTGDAERAIALLRPVNRGTTQVADDTYVDLCPAGHILGSAFAELTVDGCHLLFSGDLGRRHHPLLLPPTQPGPADVVVVESTYGTRTHTGGETDLLADTISRTAARGGSCLVPAFAIDRTAMLLFRLRDLTASGRIPRLPIFVDSPMALEALEVYRRAVKRADPDLRPDVLTLDDPFDAGNVRLCPTREDSERLNSPPSPAVIISASGMATGGRVLHHLRHQLPNPRNSVVLTGYQVAGTRGRALADHASQIKIHGRYIPVRADVVNIRGFSAHADSDETTDWLRDMPVPAQAFVVHGEPAAAAAVADRLGSELAWNAVVPRYNERVLVDS